VIGVASGVGFIFTAVLPLCGAAGVAILFKFFRLLLRL
jgi:hypothetical protein